MMPSVGPIMVFEPPTEPDGLTFPLAPEAKDESIAIASGDVSVVLARALNPKTAGVSRLAV